MAGSPLIADPQDREYFRALDEAIGREEQVEDVLDEWESRCHSLTLSPPYGSGSRHPLRCASCEHEIAPTESMLIDQAGEEWCANCFRDRHRDRAGLEVDWRREI